MWKDTLYAAPFKTSTQLLWVPQIGGRRGGESENPDFTWDQMIKAAVGQGKLVAVRAHNTRAGGWVNAWCWGRRTHHPPT